MSTYYVALWVEYSNGDEGREDLHIHDVYSADEANEEAAQKVSSRGSKVKKIILTEER